MSGAMVRLSEEHRDSIVASFDQQGFLRNLRARLIVLDAGLRTIELPFGEGGRSNTAFSMAERSVRWRMWLGATRR